MAHVGAQRGGYGDRFSFGDSDGRARSPLHARCGGDRALWRNVVVLRQLFDPDVAVPHGGLRFAVEALQADRAVAAVIFQRFGEFVFGAVRIFVCLGPGVQIDVEDFLAVEDERDVAILAGDGVVVPLADRFGHILRGRLGVVNRTDHAVEGSVLVFVHLDFEGSQHVFNVAGVDEDAAVGLLGDLEFQIQNEVGVGFFGPERLLIIGYEDALGKIPVAGFGRGVGQVGGKHFRPAGGDRMGFRGG